MARPTVVAHACEQLSCVHFFAQLDGVGGCIYRRIHWLSGFMSLTDWLTSCPSQ
jgi:hypothetical protein